MVEENDSWRRQFGESFEYWTRLVQIMKVEDGFVAELFFCPTTQLCGTFYQQAQEIWDKVRLTVQEKNNLMILCRDIRKTFHQLWPGCETKMFGSIVTGLIFRHSDVDVFIELPAHCEDEPEECVYKTMIHVLGEMFCEESEFEYVTSGPLATVPLVTLRHLKSRRHCDITFSSSVAVETSKLVKYLLHLDQRAFQLAVLVKYWSKINKLTATWRLPNHAITLLVIFFLQRKNILPSVASLQQDVLANMTEGWNTAFTQVAIECSDTDTLYRLLGEFFMYYCTFNFEDFVVCPYLGYAVRKERFQNILLLPHEFNVYKNRVRKGGISLQWDSRWCVQDAFEHNRNITKYVDFSLAWKLDVCFSHAANCYKNYASFIFLRKLIFKTSVIPPRPSPIMNSVHHFHLTDGQLPPEGRSWTFYFCMTLCLFTIYTFVVKANNVLKS